MPNKIKRYRKQRNLLQDDVGRIVGVTGRSIGNYEHGYREPRLSIAKKLADLFDTTIEDLFCL